MKRLRLILISALALSLVLPFLVSKRSESRLVHFCSKLNIGTSIAVVRTKAAREGFKYELEPYSQLKIVPKNGYFDSAYCRVYFNEENSLVFRYLERT